MPRTTINAIIPKGPFPTIPVPADSLDTSGTAADVPNSNQVLFGAANRLLVTWVNTGASARTVTFTSAPDPFNRLGSVDNFSVGAGEHGAFLVERAGWLQADGMLYFQANNAEVVFRIYVLP